MSSTQLYNESDMESYFLRSVNWLIPTLHGVYPAGRNTLPAHKRECFPSISDSSARKCKRVLLHFARTTLASKKGTAGYTVIELFVVVAIITLLASIIMATLTTTQKKARDTQRMATVNSISKSLALYAVDGGVYPVATIKTVLDSNSSVMTALIAEKAISAVPQDPLDPLYQYEYITNTVGTTYTLFFCLETNTIKGYSEGCVNTLTP